MTRVLIGCETSGVMRRAFLARGLDAWSCDILPADDQTNRHIQGDIREVMHGGWDLLCVMHPPCTRLCNSGVRWLHNPPKNPPADCTPEEAEAWPGLDREARLAMIWSHLDAGAQLFSDCWNAPIPMRAIENPVMHRYGAERITNYQRPAQTVQPWWFGDPAFKGTSFYLNGLPPLTATNKLTPPKKGTKEHNEWSVVHRASPGPNRGRQRSMTYLGIAAAAADQWGGYALRVAA